MKTALFVGRFQPMHNGHLNAIKYILRECEKLIILVGSAQRCYEVGDPFTAGERIEMIGRVLDENGLSGRCHILSVPDVMNNALWVHHVNSLVPRYDVVYSNNPLTIKLFKDVGKEVKETPFFMRKKLEGTHIRALMLKNKGWEKLVPKAVAEFVKEIKGIERMQAVARKDKVR